MQIDIKNNNIGLETFIKIYNYNSFNTVLMALTSTTKCKRRVIFLPYLSLDNIINNNINSEINSFNESLNSNAIMFGSFSGFKFSENFE